MKEFIEKLKQHIAAPGKVSGELWDYHVCLVYLYGIAYPQLEVFHYIEIVHGCPGYRSSFKLHRVKYSHRVEQPRA